MLVDNIEKAQDSVVNVNGRHFKSRGLSNWHHLESIADLFCFVDMNPHFVCFCVDSSRPKTARSLSFLKGSLLVCLWTITATTQSTPEMLMWQCETSEGMGSLLLLASEAQRPAPQAQRFCSCCLNNHNTSLDHLTSYITFQEACRCRLKSPCQCVGVALFC